MSDFSILSSLGTVVNIKKSETVFMQHDAGDCMYIVMDGTFGVYINSFSDFPVRVAGIGQGLFFGEMSVIDGSPRSATIIAEDDCSALVIGKDSFEELLEKSPEIGKTILNTLRERSNTTADAVRKAGKEPPPLPPLLRMVEYTDAKRGLMTSDPLRMAKIWMRLYWLYSDNFAKGLAVQSADKACEYYLKYLHEHGEQMSNEELMPINAILGELLFTIGQVDKALWYFKENSEIGRMMNNDLVRQSIRRYQEIKQLS